MTSSLVSQAFRLSLLTVVATLPFARAPVPLGSLRIPLTEVALAIAVALGAVHLASQAGRWKATLAKAVPGGYVIPVSLFLLAALLSLLVTEYPRLSLRELRTLIVEPVTLVVLIGLAGVGVAWTKRAVDLLIVVITAIAALALVQYALGQASVETEGVRRALGIYPSANHLALVVGRALPFAVALVLLSRGPRWPYVAATGILALCLITTFSIAGWLGTGAAILVVTFVVGGARRGLAALAGLAVLAVVVLPLLQVERVLSHLDPSRGTSFIRLQLWSASLAMVRDHPVLGIGLDNFLYLYQQDYLPALATMEPNLSHPHNWILHFWLSLGLLGLVAVLWLLVRFCGQARTFLTNGRAAAGAALTVGALGSMANFLVHGSLDNSYFLPDLAGIFWLTLLVPYTVRNASPAEEPERGPVPANAELQPGLPEAGTHNLSRAFHPCTRLIFESPRP